MHAVDTKVERDQPQAHEVVICGGGLAGLTLALQLHRRLPELDILVLDKQRSPLPPVAHKIGESTVIGGADYLCHELDLFGYLAEHQVHKLGLRFFMGDPKRSFRERPEYGRSIFRPEIHEWQFERGALEDELRRRVLAAGLSLREGAKIADIEPGEGDAPHRIRLEGDDSGAEIHARWLIDATGRRRMLQRKLGTFENVADEVDFSSSWLRVPGRVDVSELVPAEDRAWHQRVPGGYRVHSTQHIVGPGYWLWIIMLPEATSIGLVTRESTHPFSSFNTLPRLLSWLERHEPDIHRLVTRHEPFGFGVMRNYTSFVPTQVVSSDRWACTGEAACVLDPLYSAAMNGIGILNSMICELVEAEGRGELEPTMFDQVNAEFTGWAAWVARNFQRSYTHFGNTLVATAKLLWDFTYIAGLATPNVMSRWFARGFLRDPELRHAPSEVGLSRYSELYALMMELFDTWAATTTRAHDETYDFIDYLEIPYLRKILIGSHEKSEDVKGLWRDHQAIVEEVAQALFLLAVEDLAPEQLAELEAAGRLDAWALTLDRDKWADPSSMAARTETLPDTRRSPEWEDVRTQIRSLFRFTNT